MEDGRVHMENFRQLRLTQKKLFGELRQHQVEHLGQVRSYMETTGNLSIYFHPETEPVRPGLPTWPERFRHLQRRAGAPGLHACCRCGHVHTLAKGDQVPCPTC
ncbi:YetF domain-containing protein [Hymenobacter nivis]|uniref:YetF domain-containing protein n=1 Tax=Hymenobacter nivis TaxID=1850093 RepID=UPI0013A591CA|nr:YetF domain-containing protein [Hymenobacter nivis]